MGQRNKVNTPNNSRQKTRVRMLIRGVASDSEVARRKKETGGEETKKVQS